MSEGRVYGRFSWMMRRGMCRLRDHRWSGSMGIRGMATCERCMARAYHAEPKRWASLTVRVYPHLTITLSNVTRAEAWSYIVRRFPPQVIWDTPQPILRPTSERYSRHTSQTCDTCGGSGIVREYDVPFTDTLVVESPCPDCQTVH